MSDPIVLGSRRREVGTDSARSYLLTILGEFVLPRGAGSAPGAWTGALISSLAALGVEEKSARQSLLRAASEGVLESSRHGRRVRWELTESGADLLTEGTARIYGFLRSARRWDERWLVLVVPIPESERRLRHRLRTRLTWLGMGALAPGVWIVPDAGREAEVSAVLEALGLGDRAHAFIGPASMIGDSARLLATAWDLTGVEQRYREFLSAFSGRRARPPAATFTAQVQLVQDWRRFPFLDPDLPTELLEADWPGPAAADLFHDLHRRWDRPAQDEWDRMEADAAQRN